MMQISKQVDYATQLLQALATQPENSYLGLRKFSDDFNISFLFLQRIARELKAAGIIDATRGVRGGYFLIVDPKELTLKRVIEVLEGPVGITACTRGKKCVQENTCNTKNMFEIANKNMMDVLENTLVVT